MGKERLDIASERAKYTFLLDRYYYVLDPGHVWFKPKNSTFEVGFDDFGQAQAGNILHIRTRPMGKELDQHTAFGTIESEKWIGPLRLPLTGILLKANSDVLDNPALVNKTPYEAWIIEIEPTNLSAEIENTERIIPIGDAERLRDYILAEVEKYEE
ncbi:MAG: glycine cleavage system protein H [Candidatus Thorarchaeota archaeon]